MRWRGPTHRSPANVRRQRQQLRPVLCEGRGEAQLPGPLCDTVAVMRHARLCVGGWVHGCVGGAGYGGGGWRTLVSLDGEPELALECVQPGAVLKPHVNQLIFHRLVGCRDLEPLAPAA